MWWFLVKKCDDSDKVIYTYGRETYNVTGEVLYDRKTEEFSVIKLADNDTEGGVRRLMPHLYHIIFKENCPDERLIATG